MLKKVFKIPIYFGRLIVVAADDLQTAADKNGIEINASVYAAIDAKRQKNGLHEYIVIMGKNTTIETVVHESKHVVNYIFKDKGVQPDLDNDEPECYLLGWVFQKVNTVFSKYKNGC